MAIWLPEWVLQDNSVNRDTLFLEQAWRELLDPQSPDSYRARALDPFSLLSELYRVCELARVDSKWLAHVHLICEEIRDEASAIMRLPLASAAKHAVQTLSAFTTVKHDDIHRVAESARLVLDLSGNPLAVFYQHALSLIEPELKQKSFLLRSLGMMATRAHQLGRRDEFLSDENLVDLSIEPAAWLDKIYQRLTTPEQNQSCFIAVSGDVSKIDALLAGGDFSRIGVSRLGTSEVALAWHHVHSELYLAEISLTAMTPRLAAERARLRFQLLLNVLSLYANGNHHRLSHQVLVETDSGMHAVDVSAAAHYGLFARNDFARTTRQRFNELGGRLSGRLENMLSAHALGLDSNDPPAALSHFWTSLEAMVGPKGPPNIGERVMHLIAPVVTSRRIHKTVTYLALCILDVKRLTESALDFALMPASTKGHVAREDVLSCITGLKDNPGILALLRIGGVNPLLCYHLQNAWEESHDPQALGKALSRSEQRVKWQIMRIYRARNVFVHQGERDDLAWRLLENAQSYISFAAGRLLDDMSQHVSWTIDTALEFERQNFERVCDALKTKKNLPLKTMDLLIHLTKRAENVPLWGEESRFGRPPAQPVAPSG
ncbi:hypothetical protein VC273_12585 [Xanthomonas nasturtii]|uniref:hypothetical protein n=1 Tax=Xanthomonas TaxID=338 RepID=UPI002B228D08|nr:hypothetical protein [Xanthomonas nasturtii]MEA9556717.1 hypothetical protein [Xanthomonas nasturtii]